MADGHQDATGDGQGAVGVHGIVMTAVGIGAPAAQLQVHAGTDAVVGGDHPQVPAAHTEDGLGFDALGREAVVAFVVRVPGRGAGGGDVDRAAVDGDARIGIVIGTGGERVLPGLPAGGDALVVAADGDVSVVDGHEPQRLHGTFLATDLDALARRRIDGQPAAIHDEGLGGAQPVAGGGLECQVATAQTQVAGGGQCMVCRGIDAQRTVTPDHQRAGGRQGPAGLDGFTLGIGAGGIGQGAVALQLDEGGGRRLQVQCGAVGTGQMGIDQHQPVGVVAVQGDRGAAATGQDIGQMGVARGGPDRQTRGSAREGDDRLAIKRDGGDVISPRLDGQPGRGGAHGQRVQVDGQRQPPGSVHPVGGVCAGVQIPAGRGARGGGVRMCARRRVTRRCVGSAGSRCAMGGLTRFARGSRVMGRVGCAAGGGSCAAGLTVATGQAQQGAQQGQGRPRGLSRTVSGHGLPILWIPSLTGIIQADDWNG